MTQQLAVARALRALLLGDVIQLRRRVLSPALPVSPALPASNMSHARALCSLALLCAGVRAAAAPLPVLLFHGMGDAALSSGMRAVAARIAADIGAYVYSISVGAPEDEPRSSYFGRVSEQLARVCDEQLTPEARFAGGVNAVGFSQGGQFLRALAQSCGGVTFRTLVTLGAQHGGVATVPGCGADAAGGFCAQMQKLVSAGAYRSFVQTAVVQAQYLRDAKDEAAFLSRNVWLPAVNNLLPLKNETYRARIAALERLVLFRFSDDVTVVPRDSAWFAWQRGAEVVPLREQALFQEDWLGLRALDEAGRLVLADCPGTHMQFELDWFAANVIAPYLDAPGVATA